MRLRHVATATTMLIAGTVIGATTQHIASADVSTGDRSVLIPIEPCRLVDTRSANQVGPRSAPLGAGDVHTVDAQETGTPCTGAIATDALALSLNVTTLRATEQTFITIWPGGERPDASSLNPAPDAPPTPNAVITKLSVDQEFEIYNDAGSVEIIVDVNGYYVGHDHDDRYFTEAESDARFIDATELDAAIETAIIAERRQSAGRILAMGAVFGGDPARIEGNSRTADGFDLAVTRLSEGRYSLTLTGNFPDGSAGTGTDSPIPLVDASTNAAGTTCLRTSASFTGTTATNRIECFDGVNDPGDVSFRFVITAPHEDDA